MRVGRAVAKIRGEGRDGFTLLEGLVSLLLLGIVVQGGWAVFAGFRMAAQRVALEAQGLETVRSVGWVLSEELGGGVEGVDWWGPFGDSVALRAYRGVAWVGAWEEPGVVRVCYRGTRSPNPEKDSILALGEGGGWRAFPLLNRVPGKMGCAGGGEGRWEAWEVGDVEGEGEGKWVLARIFERGSYHLSGGALRYRGSRGGRQPLTTQNLELSGFRPVQGAGAGWEWVLSLKAEGRLGDSLPWRGRVW